MGRNFFTGPVEIEIAQPVILDGHRFAQRLSLMVRGNPVSSGRKLRVKNRAGRFSLKHFVSFEILDNNLDIGQILTATLCRKHQMQVVILGHSRDRIIVTDAAAHIGDPRSAHGIGRQYDAHPGQAGQDHCTPCP